MVIEHDGCKGCKYDHLFLADYPCSNCIGNPNSTSKEDRYEPAGDSVNHPVHYNHGDVECIDALRSALGVEGFLAFCKGNAIKYIWRCDFKGEEQDIEKAQWYLNKYLEEVRKI